MIGQRNFSDIVIGQINLSIKSKWVLLILIQFMYERLDLLPSQAQLKILTFVNLQLTSGRKLQSTDVYETTWPAPEG